MMASLLSNTNSVVAGSALALTTLSTGVAVYSIYKLRKLQCKKKEQNVYESKKMLSDYLIFHYGEAKDVLPYDFGPHNSLDFPKRCADLCMKHYTNVDGTPKRALDIGCAVGRSTFEMTQVFDEVIGIDFSQSFIDACNHLKLHGSMSYSVLMEGELHKNLKATVDSTINKKKTMFLQGDACNLSPNLGQFGCVLAANLICRLHTPREFLNRLASLVATGGILVITSPYTFLTEYTPKERWIGGEITPAGEVFTGFDGLKTILGPAFDLVAEENMPFFIRETARKNQWTVAHATVWRRKS